MRLEYASSSENLNGKGNDARLFDSESRGTVAQDKITLLDYFRAIHAPCKICGMESAVAVCHFINTGIHLYDIHDLKTLLKIALSTQ
jgi:hypothetical protein